MLKKLIWGLILILLVVAAIIMYVSGGETVNPLTYFDEFKQNEYNLVYEDERIDIDEPVVYIGEQVYVAYEFARNYISDIIFYDEEEGVLTLTNAREVVRLYPGSNEAIINGKKVSVPYDIQKKDGKIYVSETLLNEWFGVTLEVGKDKKLYIAKDSRQDQVVATIKFPTKIRTHMERKATIIDKLKRGEKVNVYNVENGFARVRSSQGIIGYVPEYCLKDLVKVEGTEKQLVEPWPSNPLGKQVKLVWDQLTVKTPGNWDAPKYTRITNANVISPTWFEFGDAEGNLIDRGTTRYVESAHARGLQVWPLISHNFVETGLTKTILSSTSKRQHVIDQLISKAKQYGYDGINIDIENIQTETSDVWVQFVRELYPQLKAAGLIVSVDVYMPSAWSNHYERGKVSEVCDYFIVMAYDQHWAGSEEAGSVAELPWVEEGLQKNLEEVPNYKLVLGVPFYTRVWKETSKGLEVKSLSLSDALARVAEWGETPVFDPNSGQLYAEHQVSDGLYKIWLEDKDSMAARMELIKKYDLAGFGGWKIGLETDEIWDALEKVQD